MTNVIPFRSRTPVEPPESANTHMSGPAVCLSCAHEWTMVAPSGTPVNAVGDQPGLECPACGSFKGVSKYFTRHVDCPSWRCTVCGSFIFSAILAHGDVPCLACACCGNLTNALDLFPAPG